jgi:glucosamine-6-phosphate deaminase
VDNLIVLREAAKYIFSKIEPKLSVGDQFVLGMATGNTPIKMYDELLALFRGTNLDFSEFYTVNLDEYFPIKKSDPQSYMTYMSEKFWIPLHQISSSFDLAKQGILPNGEAADGTAECVSYEDRIKQLGGIDLQILGIGTNGHIGFNEPGSPSDSRTRVVQLAESTIKDNTTRGIQQSFGATLRARTMYSKSVAKGEDVKTAFYTKTMKK